MKKTLIAALVGAAVMPAMAQTPPATANSVTLFGVVDLNLRNSSFDGESLRRLDNNGISSSRVGLRGVEDLGGGLRAGFWLEHGLTPDTGGQSDAARFWNRRATASLITGFGEVRLGRDLTPTFTGFADFDVFGTNGVGDASKFNVAFPGQAGNPTVNTFTRADNMIQLILPGNLGGVYGTLAAAAGEGTLGSRYIAGRLGYAAGPVNVSVAYGTTQTAVAPAAIGGDDALTTLTVAGSYDLQVVRVLGYWQRNEYGNLTRTNVNIGLSAPLGPGALRASFIQSNVEGGTTAANDATQLAVGYTYNLSRRTALYGTYARVANDATGRFVVAGSPPARNATNRELTSSGFEVGVRHNF